MPWIVFVIPGVGPIIHQMRPTGFDEVGESSQMIRRPVADLTTSGHVNPRVLVHFGSGLLLGTQEECCFEPFRGLMILAEGLRRV